MKSLDGMNYIIIFGGKLIKFHDLTSRQSSNTSGVHILNI